LTYRITVENISRSPAHHVALRNPRPKHARFVRATPPPTTMSPAMLWQLGTLNGRAHKEIVLVVVPTGGGDIENCARVQFEHGECVRTRVKTPKLQISHTGPKKAELHDPVAFRLKVTNSGKAPARNVEVDVTLPESVEYSDSKPSTTGEKNPLTWSLGTLRPGQSKGIEYSVITKKTGRFTLAGVARASGGLKQESSATMRVGEAKLEVLKTGPKQRTVGRPATYLITVSNPGTMPAKNVEIADELPADITFVRASTGGKLVGEQVRWKLPVLEAGTRRTVEVVVKANRAGTFRNVSTATADRGLSAKGRAETQFERGIGLALEIDPQDNPIEAGRETTVRVRALNAGQSAAPNVGLTITVPEEMIVVDAKGPTTANRDGQKITFAPLANLGAGMDATYTVRVRAEKAGTANWVVETGSVRLEEGITVVEPLKRLAEEGRLVGPE
jgi:uncharacterized repeat protein (TIGR01451 family)